MDVRRRNSGVTIMELLVVLGLITLISAFALGMMKRRDRELTLEANAKLVRATLRLARNSARAAGTGSVVRLDPERNVMEASPVEIGGNWHFEDATGSRGTSFSHDGDFKDGGKIGRCLELAGGSVDLGSYPFYEATDGFKFSLWVRPTQDEGGVLFLREGSFKLQVTGESGLTGEVSVGPNRHTAVVETRPGLIVPGRWSHVALSYDRIEVAIEVNHVRYAMRREIRPMTPVSDAHLFIGSGYEGLHGFVDEARYDVVIGGTVDELSAGAEFMPDVPAVIRFNGRGQLDARFHKGPAIIRIKGDDGEETEGRVEVVRIELSGAVR